MLQALLRGEITQNEYLNYNNIELRFEKLPKYVYGFIYEYKDKILIAINKNLSESKKRITILHEFAHYELNHLEVSLLEFKFENLEDEADKYLKYLLENSKTII